MTVQDEHKVSAQLQSELALRAQHDSMIHPLIKAALPKRLAELPLPDPEEK